MYPQRSDHVEPGDPLAAIARAAVHDQEAAVELIRATQGDVWRLCRALIDDQAAADVAQDTYIKVLQALPAFRGESSVRVWILAIARRTAIDHLRKIERQRKIETMLRRERRAASHPLTSNLEAADLLAQLPTGQRTAFVLTQILGLDYAEAAAVMNCPIGTIRSRVARARTGLAAAIEE